MPTFKYRGVVARQSGANEVVTIAARASDVLAFASISRAGRPEGSSLQGFQRPPCAAHIREIRDYLRAPDAVLPNSIVVGFIDGIEMRKVSDEIREITIDARDGPKGYIIDGQQRLIALGDLDSKDFELFVSVLVCPNIEELRRQFVLVNSARPLPKALIDELLPEVAGSQDA